MKLFKIKCGYYVLRTHIKPVLNTSIQIMSCICEFIVGTKGIDDIDRILIKRDLNIKLNIALAVRAGIYKDRAVTVQSRDYRITNAYLSSA